jgi:hypothetical protein
MKKILALCLLMGCVSAQENKTMSFLPNYSGDQQLQTMFRLIDERLSELYSVHGKRVDRDVGTSNAVVGDEIVVATTTTASSVVGIPKSGVTINTTGKNVFYGLASAQDVNNSYGSVQLAYAGNTVDPIRVTGIFYLYRDGVRIDSIILFREDDLSGTTIPASGWIGYPPSSVSFVDKNPTPGTHIYNLMMVVNYVGGAGPPTVLLSVSGVRAYAYEF